jgi:hypothetical protein
MSEHTPGPWRAEGYDVFGDEPSRLIADCNCGRDFAEAVANARMFAAAPDMLEALQRTRTALCAEFGHGVYRVNFAYIDTAIAKATGAATVHARAEP